MKKHDQSHQDMLIMFNNDYSRGCVSLLVIEGYNLILK